MRFNKKLLFIPLLMVLVQCESFLQRFVDEHSTLVSDNGNPNLLLNNIQLETRNVFRQASSIGGELTRMEYMFGSTYQNAFSPSTFDAIYTNAFSDVFPDADVLIEIAADRQLYAHAGMAKVLKAYNMITMVDLFGDIPYSNELDGTELNPELVEDELIYYEALALLDSAIVDLQNPLNRSNPDFNLYEDDEYEEEDPLIFYYFETPIIDDFIESWIRAANTIKFKAHLNMGNVAEINGLLTDNYLVTDSNFDFSFKYSTIPEDPDSRHPRFTANYQDYGTTSYMAVNYMNMLLTDKETIDPRINYYFYRESVSDPQDINENTCIAAPAPSHFDSDDPWCLIGLGYSGRDHLINDGIPGEGPNTTFGIYPIGGAFDYGFGGFTESDDGLRGAGIEPLLLSSFTYFMIAEAELVHNGNEARARAALETALEHSFIKVAEFGEEFAAGLDEEIVPSTISDYQDIVLARFDEAQNQSEKLRVIAREYYFALWGNGYEAYNLMRRTGFPDRDDNLQPARTPAPGNWYRSVLYPANMVSRNDKIEQKSDTDILQGPFWDPDKGSTKFNF